MQQNFHITKVSQSTHHITRMHTETKNKCKNCNFREYDEAKLREHIKQSHSDVLNSSFLSIQTQKSDTNVNDELLLDLEKTSWEEKRVDE